ncbi:hypothetical protein Droror1_Dr00014285 [Drosera rotundifolia]
MSSARRNQQHTKQQQHEMESPINRTFKTKPFPTSPSPLHSNAELRRFTISLFFASLRRFSAPNSISIFHSILKLIIDLFNSHNSISSDPIFGRELFPILCILIWDYQG